MLVISHEVIEDLKSRVQGRPIQFECVNFCVFNVPVLKN